jgi:hypothetical protein
MMSEGVDYELTPCDQVENDQAWDIRVLRGEFVESVLRFGNISFNEENDCLNFNFLVVSSPNSSATEENETLQIFAGDILQSVLEDAIANDALLTKEKDED